MRNFAYFLGVLTVSYVWCPELVVAAQKKVKIEAPYEYVKADDGRIKIKKVPYRERRPKWNLRFNLAINNKIKTKAGLESDGTGVQIDLSMNRNFKYFSIGPEVGYSKSKILNVCQNEIDFSGLNLGAGLYLDGLFETAYVVPFVSLGGIMPDITVETIGATCSDVTGKQDLDSKNVVFYYRAGFLLGLNWLDHGMASRALNEYGLQNSFLYVAIRKISETSDISAADLSTEPFLEYGLQLEF